MTANQGNNRSPIKPISYVWRRLFLENRVPMDGVIVEVAPGYETKIGDALALLEFHGTIILVEPVPAAAAHIGEAYKDNFTCRDGKSSHQAASGNNSGKRRSFRSCGDRSKSSF